MIVKFNLILWGACLLVYCEVYSVSAPGVSGVRVSSRLIVLLHESMSRRFVVNISAVMSKLVLPLCSSCMAGDAHLCGATCRCRTSDHGAKGNFNMKQNKKLVVYKCHNWFHSVHSSCGLGIQLRYSVVYQSVIHVLIVKTCIHICLACQFY